MFNLKKLIKFILPASLFVTLFALEPSIALAQAAATQGAAQTSADLGQQALLNLQSMVGVVLSLLNILIWPLLSMIGALMGNDLIFGPQVEDRLLLIWGQLRNFVNLIFVLVLVGLAIYNVFGIGEDGNYTIKKILPKFILALIVVNFTFFGAKMILSASNVLTSAVFALPSSIESEFASLDPSQLAAKNCPNLVASFPKNNGVCSSPSTFTPQAEQFFSTFSADNIAFLMAMNLANISEINNVSRLVTEAPTITNVAVNILISVILYVIYAIAFVALFIVLIVRVVVLWFLIACSPVLALQIVLPDATKSIAGDFDIQSLFIKHTFAPVIIGAGMTLGYLMLDAYKQNTAPSLGSSLQIGADFANAFSVGQSGLQEVMIGLAAAAIVWKVTFTAAEGTLAAGITNGIKSTIGSFAGRVAALPKYLQWIPIPANLDNDGKANGKASVASIFNTADSALGRIEQAGKAPIGGFNKPSILSYAKDPSAQSKVNDELILRTFNFDTEVQQNLNLKGFRLIVKRSGLDEKMQERLLKPFEHRSDSDFMKDLIPTVKGNLDWKSVISDLHDKGYNQSESIDEASKNKSTLLPQDKPSPAPAGGQPPVPPAEGPNPPEGAGSGGGK